MASTRFSIEELAAETGVEARTIRSYIQQGLMEGPDALGRNAYYTDYHVKRLRNIKFLREYHGLQLKEIRQVLLSLGDRLLTPEAPGNFGQGIAESSENIGQEQAKSALDFIKLIKGQRPTVARPLFVPDASKIPLALESGEPLAAIPGTTPLEQLLAALEKTTASRAAPRASRGENWIHIEITPDVKLLIRGEYSVDEIALLERIADNMRQIMLGKGYKDDNTNRA